MAELSGLTAVVTGGGSGIGLATARLLAARGAAGAHHAEHIDVQDPVPLVVRVVLDGAGRADAGVVHQDVDAAHPHPCRLHRLPHRRVVADVGGQPDELIRELIGRLEVEHGDRRAARREQPGGRQPDPRAAAGDDRLQPA